MKLYTVKQLATLSGVTVRTLHHYDKIGLLSPACRSEKNYRYYGREELLRLQQILFYRELGIPLEEIKVILEDPTFDLLEALESHRDALWDQSLRIEILLETVDKTIDNLKNKTAMTDEEMYAGLRPEDREARRNEVADRWGQDELEKAEARVRKMGKRGLALAKAREEAINKHLAKLIDRDPADREVQLLILQLFEHLQQFTPIGKDRFRGLGRMYTQDERFRQHYDQHAAGLADFVYAGIEIFCNNDLKIR